MSIFSSNHGILLSGVAISFTATHKIVRPKKKRFLKCKKTQQLQVPVDNNSQQQIHLLPVMVITGAASLVLRTDSSDSGNCSRLF